MSLFPYAAAVAAVAVMTFAASDPAAGQARPEVQGTTAAVVADHPLAAAAGADVLSRGGNAVDAAVTMAAVLAVVRPHMNGVGGDAFMLIREGRSGRVHALNGSGRAGSRAIPAAFRARGLNQIPRNGVLSVTVPGAVRAWADALRRHGSIGLAEALAPAIRYAEQGFPVSEKLAADIAASRTAVAADPAMAAVFLVDGVVPAPGMLLRQPDLARTLRQIAEDGAETLYSGDLARRLAGFMSFEDGFITVEDLAAHSSTWQQPISTTYGGYRVLAFPPNTQGVALLMQMNMAELFDPGRLGHNQPDYIHTLVEIKKLAFAERDRLITDPAFAEIPLDQMLSKERARELVATWEAPATSADGDSLPAGDTVRPRGSDVGGGPDGGDGGGDGDTVFLGVVDSRGNAVSLIQSLFSAFGSGRMVPGTGIVLHNRGSAFSLEDDNVNVVAPRKRTYHTLSPSMVLDADGALFMVLGTPGSDGQTQTQLQVFNNIVFFGMTPQRAVEAPRWRSWGDGRLQIEEVVPEAVRDRLRAMNHDVRSQGGASADLGGAQVILITSAGAIAVGADPRREAYGIAW